MKIFLALLSGLCFLLAAAFLFLCLSGLDGDYDTETDSRCTTLPPGSAGSPTIETCTGTDEAGGQLTFALFGASFLLSGAVLATASVGVRRRDRRDAIASTQPWAVQQP